MVRALLQRPLLVLFYLAAADVQCEGEMPMGHLDVRVCVCGGGGTMFFFKRHTFSEVLWSIFIPQLILVYGPLFVCLEAAPGL